MAYCLMGRCLKQGITILVSQRVSLGSSIPFPSPINQHMDVAHVCCFLFFISLKKNKKPTLHFLTLRLRPCETFQNPPTWWWVSSLTFSFWKQPIQNYKTRLVSPTVIINGPRTQIAALFYY